MRQKHKADALFSKRQLSFLLNHAYSYRS